MQDANENRQSGRRAVVFGATGGIGHALCEALSGEGWRVAAVSRRGAELACADLSFTCDMADETSIAAVADRLRDEPPSLVVVATGVLTLSDGTGPERSLRHIDGEAMAEAFRVNTIGPALIAKHMLPLFAREGEGVFAALGARVGSIGDNRLGGWHSYRASKAALAMLIRNFAIETRRTHPGLVVIGLHPGTVDTPLSEPFQRNLPDGQLTGPRVAAEHLLRVIAGAKPEKSGAVLDWKGDIVPP
ncbi:SDR family NAD(P)-dependent oxidoreductase [Qipengyuania sp.]|uniref:SDR family NAD(P)-dependent oxidoreductase n=1 Tax=Qipengyuania sp. TaxID=2004515 RepID=UPI0035C85EF1